MAQFKVLSSDLHTITEENHKNLSQVSWPRSELSTTEKLLLPPACSVSIGFLTNHTDTYTDTHSPLCIHFVYFIPVVHLLHKTNSSALEYVATPDMIACNCGIVRCGRDTHNKSAVATHHVARPATQTV
jgi:hypothetical protein